MKLVARPDARMVEVPLEIEAELPREFDGNALLASSGLPRKVKIKAQKDAIKLSTAYRADQLLADIVRSTLRGTPQDVQRVQDATRNYVRTVRERRQDGATLLVQSNGRGKIEVSEQIPTAPAPAASRTPPPPVRAPGAAAEPGLKASSTDRLAVLEKRLKELESAIPRIISEGEERGKLEERLAKLEEKMAGLQNTVSRAGIASEVAGPGMEPRVHQATQRPAPMRRNTAVEAFADGLRDELRVRVKEQLDASQRTSALCDRAALLAVEAEQSLGAPRDGTAQRLRTISALGAARQQALRRVQEELDLYQPADMPVAALLVSRLEEKPGAPEPTAPLQALVETVVRDGKGDDAGPRLAWITRAAALCSWTLIEPLSGERFDAELHEAIGGGGGQIQSVAAPGLRRHDGSVLSKARVVALPVSVPPPPSDEVEHKLAPQCAVEQKLAPLDAAMRDSASDVEAAMQVAAPQSAAPDDHAHLLWTTDSTPPPPAAQEDVEVLEADSEIIEELAPTSQPPPPPVEPEEAAPEEAAPEVAAQHTEPRALVATAASEPVAAASEPVAAASEPPALPAAAQDAAAPEVPHPAAAQPNGAASETAHVAAHVAEHEVHERAPAIPLPGPSTTSLDVASPFGPLALDGDISSEEADAAASAAPRPAGSKDQR